MVVIAQNVDFVCWSVFCITMVDLPAALAGCTVTLIVEWCMWTVS